MIAFLSLLPRVVVSPFKTKARLEAGIIMLRRSAKDTRRDPPPDPGDEPGQSAVWRAPHPW
jgi:hypothetical protein